MTVHVSVRSISAVLLLCVSLLGLPAGAPAQSVVAPQKTAPTLAERLDRLAAEFDRNRIDLHVPGVALAIVRGDDVIFARGFGVADIEKKTPVTTDTPFFIGSATKAFTATLVGMLVDEGRMQWDDPVEKHLPEFKLKVQSKDPNDRATLRDVLSHRTGFTRMGLLDMSTGMSSDEILRRASSAEPIAPFRQRFLYNSQHYLAAGSAEVFTVSERNGRLRIDIPSRLESALNPPRADGRWSLVMTDQLAVSFDRDHTGKVVGLKLHEAGLEYEVPREGVVITPEIPLSALQKYVGRYGDVGGTTEFAILIRNQRLAVRVVRAGVLGGRKVYGVQLESAGLPPALVTVDAQTGDVLHTQQTMWSAEAGVAVAIPVTTTYSDFREVGGMRVSHRYIASTDVAGRTIFQVERVEVNVELPPDTFTLEPSTSPGSGR